MTKKRLDLVLHTLYPNFSRQQLQGWIMQGKARVDGKVQTKSGTMVDSTAVIELVVDEPKFVSRAGFKLEKALDHFGIDVVGLVVLDAGLSTGGFSDCMLQRGVKKIYGIEVGYGQAHEKIRMDPRVQVRERTNLRTLMDVGELVDLVTLDLSFISVLKVMDAVCALTKPDGQLVVLIKPQFEAQKNEVGKGGIIRDDAIRNRVVQEVVAGVCSYGFRCVGVIQSPIAGADGNIEFLAYFRRVVV
jgi:23S rRNA (cytidine1920-2'-O)/16S rRNA (cytidine1409-2'-O)-methyltransferase